jgi:hypothetical protein
MSYSTSRDTITVNDVEYDVERTMRGDYEALTLTLDGEEVFEGLEGRIGMDDFYEHHNPREWSNVGTMAVSYNRYDLGDEDISKIDFEITCPTCEGSGITDKEIATTEDGGDDDLCERCEGTGYIELDPITYFKSERNARVVLPLIVYEHSGITMSVGHVGDYPFDSAGWDTSFVGFIFDTPEGIKECMGEGKDLSDEEIIEALRSEVSVYASYLEGDVTFYSVDDFETEYHEGCGGYVGDHKHCEEECFASMESAIERRLEELAERAEWAARDTMTI